MTQRICNKREPAGILRCELPFGHDKGPRSTMHESEGTSWGHHPLLTSSPKRTPMKRTPMKRVSDKGEARNAWLQAILYGKLVGQVDVYGYCFCLSCDGRFGSDIEEALSILQPGHIEERRHDPGKGVRFGSGGKVTRIGTDSWENVAPICKICNRGQDIAQRSEPMFTKGEIA